MRSSSILYKLTKYNSIQYSIFQYILSKFLLVLSFHIHIFINCIFTNQFVDENVLFLSLSIHIQLVEYKIPINSSYCLKIVIWVPIQIIKNTNRSNSQIETNATSFGRNQKDLFSLILISIKYLNIRILTKLSDFLISITITNTTIQTNIFIVLIVQIILNNIQHLNTYFFIIQNMNLL